jgi:IS30 family transposase
MSIRDQIKKLDLDTKDLCHYAKIIKQLSVEDLQELETLFARKVANHVIAKILVNEGYTVSKDVIRNHVAKQCRCESA